MIEPTPAQINAAVVAAHAFVASMTRFDVSHLISNDKFVAGITEIVIAALNAPSVPNQPLAP